MEENKCCERTKHRSEKEKKDLITRLNRIEGQVRGLRTWWRKNAIALRF